MLVHTPPTSFRGLLHEQALLRPNAPALLQPTRPALTYSAWFEVAENACSVLARGGYGRADRVALVLPDGPAFAAALIGLCSFAPLAPFPVSATAFELERAFRELEISAVIVPLGDGIVARRAAGSVGASVIELEERAERGAGAFVLRCPRRGPAREGGSPSPVALLMRTSGTTGEPKTVVLPARKLRNASQRYVEAFALTKRDRCLLAQPLVHAAGFQRVACSVESGGSTVVLGDHSVAAIFAALDEEISWLCTSPATYHRLLAELPAHRDVVQRTRLRFLRVGGAPLDPDVAERLEAAFDAPMIQAYSMTEATLCTSTPFPPARRPRGSVGIARGCEIAIVDDAGTHLPAGGVGSVIVRGPNVMVDGWFHTGDVGRHDAEGYLYILGRRREMINRGGRTIIPSDVEDALRADPRVAEAAAFAVAHETLGEEVAAAVVLRADVQCTEDELRDAAATRLAFAQTPKRIFIRPELPQTLLGKIKRGELRAVYEPLLQAEDACGPESELEGLLASAFAQVLDRRQVGCDSDFFLTGGDSLRALRLIAAVHQNTGAEIDVPMLFRAATPRRLAATIAAGVRPAPDALNLVQAGTKRVPFVLLDGGLTSSTAYPRRFAAAFDPERTVYTLASLGATPRTGPPTIEALAAEHVARIERELGSGPYLLGGYCNGGVLAYEIAARLRRRGAIVGPLLLIAATAVNGPFRRERAAASLLASALRLPSDHEHRLYRHLRGHAVALRGSYAASFGRRAAALLRRRSSAEAEGSSSEAQDLMREAMQRYHPQRYDGEVHLVWPDEDVRHIPGDPSMGWSAVAGRLAIHHVPGDHLALVSDDLQRYADVARHIYASFD